MMSGEHEGEQQEPEPSGKRLRTVDYGSVVNDLVNDLEDLIKQLDQYLDNTARNKISL